MTTIPVSPPLRQSAVRAPAAQKGQRTLASYLLVPRPKDLIKAVVLPLGFAVGAAATGGVSMSQLGRAALVWVVLELLVYQARYQWNDVRGFAADQAHPEAASRGRLPGPIERARPHITASLAVAALRLALTALVALALPDLRGVIVAMTVGVFGVAFVYEHVRSMATGRTAEVPVPLHPALLGLWVVVGAGYAVRGLTGLALAVGLSGRPGLVATAVVAMWSLGIVFVTCRWALEAMCFAGFRGGHVVWDDTTSKAREHTLGLVRWLPSYVDVEDYPATNEPAHWRALLRPTPLTAPWNLALVAAAAAAALAGRLLVGGEPALDVTVGATAALVGGAAAIVLALTPHHRGVAAVVLAAGLAGLQAVAGLSDAVAATLPWLVVGLLYSCFTHQCAGEIGRPLRRLEPLLHR